MYDLQTFGFTSSHITVTPSLSQGITSQSIVDESQDLLLYTLGGNWNGIGDINTIDSWIDNPLDFSGKHSRTNSYNMFMSASGCFCLAIPPTANIINDDAITSEGAESGQYWKVSYHLTRYPFANELKLIHSSISRFTMLTTLIHTLMANERSNL